jgi:murein DD-endopeptidase MepM/ murein hydrolase activator NlpD
LTVRSHQETVLRNASVGVQGIRARLRPDQSHRSAAAVTLQRRSISIARAIRAGSIARPTLSGERLVSVTAVGLVAIALVLSNLGTSVAAGPVGNTSGAGVEPRIALGGAVSGLDNAPQGGIDDRIAGDGAATGLDNADLSPGTWSDQTDDTAAIDGPFGSDGTLVKPISVDTTVTDGSALLRTYRVKSGDTLTGIAHKFHVSMMTVWWANHLKTKDDLKVGQWLTIPPVNGVVVTVATSDTLDALASKYHVDATEIVDVNQLTDKVLVVGQTLTIPGALSSSIATPKPAKKPVVHTSGGGGGGGSSGGSTRPPAQYTGGKLSWPVAGGYISQYFHYGHYAIDIAADQGTRVKAAAGGRVIFAGWKNNGGGYQVWIAHGSNLYTTYNHMSSISVGRGQSVSRGQQVGRVGMTGNATGPHLHFEVWIGPVWDGGTRVNPLNYL